MAVDLAENLTDHGQELTLVVLWSPTGAESKRFERIRENPDISIRCLELDSHKELPTSIPRMARMLRPLGKRTDIVHSHHVVPNAIGAIVSRYWNVPLVITNHNVYHRFHTAKKIERPVTIPGAISVYNSKETQRSFGLLTRLAARNDMIYNGLNISRVTDRGGVIRDRQGTDVAFVARLVKQKDPMTALRAFRQLKGEEIRLHIAGFGPLTEAVKDFITENHLNNVFWYGYMSEKQKYYRLLNDVDAFLLTSLYEGGPKSILEAMYCRNQIISTAIEPIQSEIVGESGHYFPPGAADELTQTLRNINNATERKREKDELRRRVVERFSMEEMCEQYIELYGTIG